MQTQSLLFSRADGWTESEAKQWAKSHGYKHDKVDVTDRYVRLRQLDPRGFTVKRTIPFGKGIRAVVAREETMPKKKKSKTTRRPAKRSAARKPASPAQKAARARFAARFGGKKHTATASKTRRPKHKRVREATMVAAKRRPKKRRVRETPAVAEAKRLKKKSRAAKKTHRKAAHRKASYVMAKRRPAKRHAAKRHTKRPTTRRRAAHRKHKVQAWVGDSAGHSKAAKKGWKTRKGSKPGKAHRTTKKAAESRRRPRKRAVRETMTVQARRRPRKHTARASTTVQARRRPRKHTARASTTVQARRRPHGYVRAPNYKALARSAGEMTLELGAGVAGFLIADAVDRFLATYDPAGAKKPSHKFTSDGTGTLANTLNIASAPDLWRYGALGVLTLLPLGGSLFVKHPMLRASTQGVGIGAGIKFVATVWANLLMPLLVGKDTSVPALQKSLSLIHI